MKRLTVELIPDPSWVDTRPGCRTYRPACGEGETEEAAIADLKLEAFK